MERSTDGNVFMFSFSQEGFEAIVNLTELDEQYVMAKMADEKLPQTVDSLLHMVRIRASMNQHRRMEVWLAKLDDSWTDDELLAMADEDPQMVANLARMGEWHAGFDPRRAQRAVIE